MTVTYPINGLPPGNAHAVRAIEVGEAAKVRVLLVGNPKVVDRVRLKDSMVSFLAACPCGNFGDPLAVCVCNPQQIIKHRRVHRKMIEAADIRVKVVRPRFGDYPAKVWERFGEEAVELLKVAWDRVPLYPCDITPIKNIAETIALAEGAKKIGAAHLAEALQYRHWG